jgi:ArsR family transcriptional regulator, arsenate/arsenite/antimonite-responsive transcriptional repressor
MWQGGGWFHRARRLYKTYDKRAHAFVHRFAERYHLTSMASRHVSLDDRQFTLITKALADPKRFEMLQKIGAANETATCSSICECVGLAPATVSHHLKELFSAGLIDIKRDGKFAYPTLRRDIWEAYLTRLSAL